jgi:hypothetical protein
MLEPVAVRLLLLFADAVEIAVEILVEVRRSILPR